MHLCTAMYIISPFQTLVFFPVRYFLYNGTVACRGFSPCGLLCSNREKQLNWKRKHWHWNISIWKSCIGTGTNIWQNRNIDKRWYFDVFFSDNLQIFLLHVSFFSVQTLFTVSNFYFWCQKLTVTAPYSPYGLNWTCYTLYSVSAFD